jgi:site-specific DNA-methyltransferase (adenine-specific)
MAGFENKVFNQDVLEVLRSLPDASVDTVYGDPDYNVGVDYAGRRYSQQWDEYVQWYVELARESLRVLKPTGNLFMINYPRQNAYLWVNFLDRQAYAVSEYVWVYNTNIGHSKKKFTTAHRSILHATKSADNHFYKENVPQPYKNPTDRRIRKLISAGRSGRMPYSWFYYDLVKNVSRDKTFHACQIPLGLVETLIQATTRPGDVVFILFGGSGSEVVLCRQLGRQYISCELHPEYYQMIVDRLKHDGRIRSEHRLNGGRRRAAA